MEKDKNIARDHIFRELIAPLGYLGIHDFLYFDFYKNGKIFSLASNQNRPPQEYFCAHFKQYTSLEKDILRQGPFIESIKSDFGEYGTIKKKSEKNKDFIIYEPANEHFYGYIFKLNNYDEDFNVFHNLRPYLYRFIIHLKGGIERIVKQLGSSSWMEISIENQAKVEERKLDINIQSFLQAVFTPKLPITDRAGKITILSPKQSTLVKGLARGMSYQEIELNYGIKKKAGELYLANIKSKTGWNNRIEIINAFIGQNPWIKNELMD